MSTLLNGNFSWEGESSIQESEHLNSRQYRPETKETASNVSDFPLTSNPLKNPLLASESRIQKYSQKKIEKCLSHLDLS